jgi:hypothetical protein
MTDDDVQPLTIAGLPGTRYEACWGRKTLKAATFIGRVYEWVDGGGVELWHCGHRHPSKAAAQDCARQWAVFAVVRDVHDGDAEDGAGWGAKCPAGRCLAGLVVDVVS